MWLKITKELGSAVGLRKLSPYGIDENDFLYRDKAKFINISRFRDDKINKLAQLLKPHTAVQGVSLLLKDIDTWLSLTADNTKVAKPRSVSHFTSMLTLMLNNVPGHRVYQKDEDRDVWYGYYVNNIRYNEEVKPTRNSSGNPPSCTVQLVYSEFGIRHSTSIHFDPDDCLHRPIHESLIRQGYCVETPSLRELYLHERDRFLGIVSKIGKQFLATGVATDDLDGNKEHKNGWWYNRVNTIKLERDGEPTRVVIDVTVEGDGASSRSDNADASHYFWDKNSTSGDDGSDGDENSSIAEVEVPIHPMLACFDLKRHTRLRIHVGQLTEYKYNTILGDKLVLPKESRELVSMLLANKGGFQDIISHKGNGAVILCAGLPGTGKTLTAEVYSEVMSRPLYSVQASQLGTTPDSLEDELLKVFARAARWNAILLLDEADVYVATRGSDLYQNAIVGVFLRVLEYYNGVLFLTTNRADLVDDAIASRCIARIDYGVPSVADQKRIWQILSSGSKIQLSEQVIDEIITKHSNLTGRDIKNLLKLAQLVVASYGDAAIICADTIDFVKHFKPTGGHNGPRS